MLIPARPRIAPKNNAMPNMAIHSIPVIAPMRPKAQKPCRQGTKRHRLSAGWASWAAAPARFEGGSLQLQPLAESDENQRGHQTNGPDAARTHDRSPR
jgi:hypothetical protein